jgi:hypothetical protein
MVGERMALCHTTRGVVAVKKVFLTNLDCELITLWGGGCLNHYIRAVWYGQAERRFLLPIFFIDCKKTLDYLVLI